MNQGRQHASLGTRVAAFLKIRAHPVRQHQGFPDVEYFTALAFHQVHAGLIGQVGQGRFERRGEAGHG